MRIARLRGEVPFRADYKGVWAGVRGGMMPALNEKDASQVRPDKQKVVDEVWNEARIRGFLDKAPLGAGVDPDFSALLFAYRSMRPDDFRIFIDFFTQAGRNLDARGEAGETLAELIAEHRQAGPFRRILEDAAARLAP